MYHLFIARLCFACVKMIENITTMMLRYMKYARIGSSLLHERWVHHFMRSSQCRRLFVLVTSSHALRQSLSRRVPQRFASQHADLYLNPSFFRDSVDLYSSTKFPSERCPPILSQCQCHCQCPLSTERGSQ